MAVIDKDSNFLWRFPVFLNSPYDPRKVYWVTEDGDTARPIFLKYQLYATSYRFVRTNQIDQIDSAQMVSNQLTGKEGTFSLFKDVTYYLHFPNGDIDTIFYSFRRENDVSIDSACTLNGKPITFHKGIGKYPEYGGTYLLIK